MSWSSEFEPLCAAIARLLHPHAEVVLHDLASDRVVGLWSPWTGRSVGEPSLLDELPREPVIGPYRKVSADGRELSSVSARLAGGRGLLCINLDRTPLLDVASLLSGFAAPVQEMPSEFVEADWREQIALFVDEHCRAQGLDRARLSRGERRELVAALDARGLFATRNAAEHAGRALHVSRTTVYDLLKEVRRDRDAA